MLELSSQKHRKRLDDIVRRNLRVASPWFAVLFLFFALGHLILLPTKHQGPMFLIAASTSFVFAAVRLSFVRGIASRSNPHSVSALLSVAVLLNCFFHSWWAPNPYLTTNFAFLIIALGMFLLSTRLLLVMFGLTLSAWMATVLHAQPAPEWSHYSFALVIAVALGGVIQQVRLHTILELETTQERFRRLSEAALEGIVVHQNGWIQDTNRAFCAMFGCDDAKVIGKHLSEFVETDRLHPSVISVELLAQRQDGSTFPVEVSRGCFRGGSCEVEVLAVRDISSRKQAEKTIEEQRQVVAQATKMAALGEMAGGISHEINNPLTAIVHRLELLESFLRRERIDPARFSEFVSQCRYDCFRIKKIIHGLSILSPGGSEEFPMETVPVARIIDDALSFLGQKLRETKIAVHMEPMPADLAIRCHPTQIVQILINLLRNSIDAIRGFDERWIRLEVEDLDERILVRVIDSGAGIRPEIRERIMHPFFTTKGPRTGTGLGLSIAGALAESHQGSLRYDADHPHTQFVLDLPKRPRSARKNSSKQAS